MHLGMEGCPAEFQFHFAELLRCVMCGNVREYRVHKARESISGVMLGDLTVLIHCVQAYLNTIQFSGKSR